MSTWCSGGQDTSAVLEWRSFVSQNTEEERGEVDLLSWLINPTGTKPHKKDGRTQQLLHHSAAVFMSLTVGQETMKRLRIPETGCTLLMIIFAMAMMPTPIRFREEIPVWIILRRNFGNNSFRGKINQLYKN